MNWFDKANEAAKYLKSLIELSTNTCIQLGSGADLILDRFTIEKNIPFKDIPHLNVSTFHKGAVILARSSSNVQTLFLSGRLHYYEGFSAQEITFPIRILHQLGIKTLIMTNASGGLNADYQQGEVVLVKDHINLMPEHPLRGQNDERFGLRFPDLSQAYDLNLRTELKKHWLSLHQSPLKEGIYAGFQGPSLETPAEYNMLHLLGADLVGMSTVPEVIVANHCDIRTAVFSIVTNLCYPPEKISPTTVEEVIEIAQRATPKIALAIEAFIK